MCQFNIRNNFNINLFMPPKAKKEAKKESPKKQSPKK